MHFSCSLILSRTRTLVKTGTFPRYFGCRRQPRWCRTASYLSVIASVALVTISGCGPHSDRLAVSGQVSLNGTPLDNGAIRFSSTGGQKLFASGTVIKNGEFNIPQDKGLPPGSYRVEINSADTKAPLVSVRIAPGQPLSPPTAPDRIPAEYNTEAKHTIDVSPAEKNHFTFEIENPRVK